ncbi:hypothetical protein [Xanthomonas sp. 4461]|uniref:hypothetical protein n=1 Tax=Xanthomonas sp. 4461 TaxID=3035313 RepID=UPI002167647A|nr:hypothetical protein [Xanthomonas sp. 4461]MCS3807746.1 hypothetical protein [Xanthomonas sp. 4461]
MSENKGLELFQEALIDWVSSVVKPENASDPAAYPANELELIDKVFRRFTEITDAVDRLDLSLSFINGNLPRRKGLKLYDYLMYHLTFYIQEVYILNERMDLYAKTILRLKKKYGLPFDEAKCKQLIEEVRLPLSGIVLTRGKHVHDRAMDDEGLRELAMFSFLAVHASDKPEWAKKAKSLYRDSKAVWVEQLTANRAAISVLLDKYCVYLHEDVQELLQLVPTKVKALRAD